MSKKKIVEITDLPNEQIAVNLRCSICGEMYTHTSRKHGMLCDKECEKVKDENVPSWFKKLQDEGQKS